MRVMVAMSGGVDSSVAAAELVGAGHEVVGVTMRLWGGESDSGCCSVADTDDARRVADGLGIDHHVFNFGDEFDRHVVTPYVDDHRAGRTPNPCVECNRHLKFDKLLRRARALGFEVVATGHHARRVRGPDGRLRVARGVDRAKDQSYVLHPLGQEELAAVRFPIGHLDKAEVRRRARALGLPTAAKPESQDVCFITRREGRGAFLASRLPLRPAVVVDADGTEVGRVGAVELVTLGQRKGLATAGGTARRYVTGVDPEAGKVVVGSRVDLLAPGASLVDFRWVAGPADGGLTVQTSAHGRPRAAEVAGGPGRAEVRWTTPQPRVAPGQAVVVYRGDEVVGGGTAA